MCNTDNSTLQYRFVGMIVLVRLIFDVQALSIYSPADDSRLLAGLINRQIKMAEDSCTVEMFAFNVHGGALRKQLEKDSTCIITIHGSNANFTFELTPFGELEMLEIIHRNVKDSR